MPTAHLLCAIYAIEENGTREIEIILDGNKYAGFILGFEENVLCYVNSCPHTGATLNWNPNRFLDFNQEFIQCTMHGALFEKKSGLCVRGPCVGAKLQSLKVELRDSQWYLTDARVSSVKIQTGYSDNSEGI